MMRAQVSVEYLIIIGFALGILIPGVFFFYKYSQATSSAGSSAQINDIGLNMISSVRSTYALGVNARETLQFVMPDTVRKVYVNPGDAEELVIEYETTMGRSQAVFFSNNIPLTTSYPLDGHVNVTRVHGGLTNYRFQSLGATVNVTEVTG